MSTAISVYHGEFGRASLYYLDKPIIKHAHREAHMTFHLQGTPAGMEISDKPCRVWERQGAAVNSWQLHNYNPGVRNAGQHLLVMYIEPSWFVDYSRSFTGSLKFGRSEIEVTPAIGNLIQKVVSLLLDGGTTDMFDGYLFKLTDESFTQSHQWTPAPPQFDLKPKINDFRVRKSIKLMTENIGNEIDMGKIATESGLSRPHFFKLFRDQMGVTPKLYWNTIRMEKALYDLTETPKYITDIGFDLGFSSQSSFSRFFALNAGMSPTDYRRVAHVLNS